MLDLSVDLGITGKTILVTGAVSGIGHETACLLGGLGARVIASDIDADSLSEVRKESGVSAALAADITSEAECHELVSQILKKFGQIDGLVHSAGVSDVVTPAAEVDIEQWQRIVDITLRGTFLMCRAVGKAMLAGNGGSIVNFSSVNGLGGIPRRHAYGPAKAAVAMLTRNLACEWAPHVRVNALAPAYIKTPMVEKLIDAGKIEVQRLEARTPMARLGESGEISRAAAFLLSDWASYITGVILPVDGGWTAYGGPGDVKTA